MILDTTLLTYNLKITLDELTIINTKESQEFINACDENNISLDDCLEITNNSPDILNYHNIPAHLTDGEACVMRAYIRLKNALIYDDIELHLGEGGPNQPTYLTLEITSPDSPKERLSKKPFAKNTWLQIEESKRSKLGGMQNGKLRELNETLSKNGISMVFEMNDLNDKLKDLSPIEILMRAEGNFSTHDDYFAFDDFGDLISYANINDVLENYEDIIS